MFRDTGSASRNKICESCYRESHYGQDGLVKAYKHCILTEIVTPSISRNICQCSAVPKSNGDGSPRTLFPVNKMHQHRVVDGTSGPKCGLLKLGELIAEEKYVGMHTRTRKPVKLSEKKLLHEARKRREEAKEAKRAAKAAYRQSRGLNTEIELSRHDANKRTSTRGSTAVAEEMEADEDVPFFMRKYTERYPFGNVHTALRIGPLVIENGVSQYVLISMKPFPIQSLY
jgi:hypothetical protein